ncbi:DNA/RNA-binding domain E.t1.c1-type [Penicillium fimorum]|uniref:DNA/RNA-binding domain E.t1.c1-type n=1 Tax=Penicillium fimorum TaxID=1882269 RepID=A0A9W9XWE6_9EURO|nr:DNA/RNA-binding domain E.t1.c1-type [Penicillium fimorum]
MVLFQYSLSGSNGTQEEPQELIKQLETHAVTKEQLSIKVNEIYARLVRVEKQCIESHKELAQSKAKLSECQWQAHVLLQQTLLDEHFDFFKVSQHPSASPALRGLADKYQTPARMWRYGVHSFFEQLLQKSPDSTEHMLNFIYFSFRMITCLLECVPDFRETWVQCLGDLARYRIAIDKKDREIWIRVSRYWYNQDPDRSAENGRIQHHLAVLARPDILQQFFHYTKAVISVRPFPDAFNSIIELITPLMDVPTNNRSLVTSFMHTHGALLIQVPVEEFISRENVFLTTLQNEITQVGRSGQQGVQLMSCNISAIFQYGNTHGVRETDFTLKLRNPTAEDRLASMEWASSTSSTAIHTAHRELSSQLISRASSLAFHTLIVMLGQVGDRNMYPSVHISIAFVWCLTLNPTAIQRLEPLVPWSLLATYLNTLFDSTINISNIEDESFPILDDLTTQQLPEDFLIRGQAWSRLYYPERFFEGAPTEDNRPSTEGLSTLIPRRERCLWLGVRIAAFARWMIYDRKTRQFTPTRLADEFAPVAQSSAYLYSSSRG